MRTSLNLLWELALKDLRLFLADRRGVLLCFAVPILLASFFGTIFRSPGAQPMARVPVYLVDEDQSPLSRRVVAALVRSERLDVTVTTRSEGSYLLSSQGSGVVLILEPGFRRLADTDKQTSLERPRVSMFHHPASELQSALAEGLFTEIALREAAETLLGPLLSSQVKARWEQPFVVDRTSLTGPHKERIDSYSHSFCGMSLQYLLFLGMDSGLLLLRERRQGIWRRLRTSPVPLVLLLGGKVLATLLVALAQLTVTFAFGYLVFGISIRSLPGFLALALACSLLAAATGLVVAALGGNEGRARSLSILAILTLSMLGGLWLPSFLLPGWVQSLALALPTTWAVRGLEGITWQGMSLARALLCAGVLVGFCVGFLALAWYAFAHSEARMAREGDRA
jgi:ABC-2 type transport system permease protein